MRALALAVLLFVFGCTKPDSAIATLEASGYSDIELEGYAFIGCGRDDDFATGFTARSPSGRRVRGAVCGGWLKGDTIRITGVA